MSHRPCWIYKGGKNQDTYVFLAELDGFDSLPDALRQALGPLTFVMELQLHPQRKLARCDATEVLNGLESRGFYLQMPPMDAPRPIRLQ